MRLPEYLADAVRLGKEVFADRFVIEAEVGVGGMGVVYRAFDQLRAQLVALKIAHEADPTTVERLDAEARALAQLKHPGIVQYVVHGVDAEGEPYLAMEWVAGETLHARLRRGRLDVRDVMMLGQRLADALEAAHGLGIVHRDIKPGNVLLPGRELEQAKLGDFGLAKTIGIGDVSSSRVVGTPGYMAPEQARGSLDVDRRSDLFSLGCLLFRCLTGVEAFEETSELTALARVLVSEPCRVSELCPAVPLALDQLVARLLAKNPEDRPVSAAFVRGELERMGESLRNAQSGYDSEAQTMESASDVFFGRYIIEDARASADNLFVARDTVLSRRVTLQVFQGVRDRDEIARLLRNTQAVAELSHPSIATIYDVGERGGIPFLVREYISGETLGNYVGEGPVDLGQRVRWLTEIARGLAAAHRAGVIHGDVNPNQVVIRNDRGGDDDTVGAIKVLNFGLKLGSGPMSATPYIAPEQRRGEPPDGSADQFAWGVMACEVLGGRLPRGADDADSMNAGMLESDSELENIPSNVVDVIRRAVRPQRTERFPSMDALLVALETDLSAVSQPTLIPDARRPPALDERASQFHVVAAALRRRGGFAVVLVVLVLIVLRGSFLRPLASLSPVASGEHSAVPVSPAPVEVGAPLEPSAEVGAPLAPSAAAWATLDGGVPAPVRRRSPPQKTGEKKKEKNPPEAPAKYDEPFDRYVF